MGKGCSACGAPLGGRVHGMCPRRRDLEPIPLCSVSAEGYEGSSFVAEWEWSVNEPRLWLKCGVLFEGDSATPAYPGGNQTLWLAGCERFQAAGRRIRGGRSFPVVNLAGTAAAPLVVPVDSGLCGYFIDVVSGIDTIRGRLSLSGPTVSGRWFAVASFWPTVDMCDEEWAQLSADAVKGVGITPPPPKPIFIP